MKGMILDGIVIIILLCWTSICLSFVSEIGKSWAEIRKGRQFVTFANLRKNPENFRKMNALIKLKREGAGYNALKEMALNGTILRETTNTNVADYRDLPLDGDSFENKCQNIIDYKRRKLPSQ